MKAPVKLDEFGLRPRNYWPKMTQEQQELVINFLAYLRTEAEQAATASGRIAAIASEDLGQLASAQYWSHAIRCIDWILYRVPHRQKFLEILLAEREGRWKIPDTLLATSSEPADSPVACESGVPKARPAVAGTPSGGTSKRSSRKRKTDQSTP